jgi:hypothetical protein
MHLLKYLYLSNERLSLSMIGVSILFEILNLLMYGFVNCKFLHACHLEIKLIYFQYYFKNRVTISKTVYVILAT